MSNEPFVHQLLASLARRTPVLDDPVPAAAGAVALPREDRPDFERTVDETIGSLDLDPQEPLSPEQLRIMTLNAAPIIAAAADFEYQNYVAVRDGARREVGPRRDTKHSMFEAPVQASTLAVVAVLAPVLFGTASVIFLALGYLLMLMHPEPSVATALRTAGWGFLAATAASVLIAMVGLLRAALGTSDETASDRGSEPEEVSTAKDAWLQALREKGIEPFLREARKISNTSRGPGGDHLPR